MKNKMPADSNTHLPKTKFSMADQFAFYPLHYVIMLISVVTTEIYRNIGLLCNILRDLLLARLWRFCQWATCSSSSYATRPTLSPRGRCVQRRGRGRGHGGQ